MRARRSRDDARFPGRLPAPRKRLGQHFLVDRQALERIAQALAPTSTDTVVEIGPGRGALTDLLVERAGRVVAIELDRDLIQHLRERYAGSGNTKIVEADVLDLDLAEIAGQSDFLLAGNVPYYITTPILFHALEAPRPRRAVFLVQREVAERVAAVPGSKTYGALSVNVQAVARPELVARVAAGAFRPPPSVESAILRITPRDDPVVSQEAEDSYRRLVQDAFGLRRKQLRRVVRTIVRVDADRAERILQAAGIDPESRPETLSPNDFARLLAGIQSLSGRGS